MKNLTTNISFRAPRTLVLVGLMGAGKTSIGRRLAQKLNLPFNDSDHEVEKAANATVKTIYDTLGEDEFRAGEMRVIKRLLSEETHVLATGGGAFMTGETRKLIKSNSISIWLKADLDTLIARVSRRNDRPLLDVENQDEVLEELINERYPVYQEADIMVETYDEPAAITVDRLIGKLNEYVKANFETNDIIIKSV
jgi:shikimate kinase